MNKFLIAVFLISIMTAISCADKYENENRVFNKYLSETFDRKIPVDSHTFLVESSFQCLGCVDKTYLSMLDHAKSNQQKSITIITFDDANVPEQLKTKLSVVVDEDAKYESLGIPFGNITVIETQANHIISIKCIQLDKIDVAVQDVFR